MRKIYARTLLYGKRKKAIAIFGATTYEFHEFGTVNK